MRELWPFSDTLPLIDPACSSFSRQCCYTPAWCWLCSAAEDALFQHNPVLSAALIFRLAFPRGSGQGPTRPLNRYGGDMTMQICLTPMSTSCFNHPPNYPVVSAYRWPKLQGATVKRDKSTGAIVVARIMRGGAADKSGELSSPWADCADCVVTRHRKSAQVEAFVCLFVTRPDPRRRRAEGGEWSVAGTEEAEGNPLSPGKVTGWTFLPSRTSGPIRLVSLAVYPGRCSTRFATLRQERGFSAVLCSSLNVIKLLLPPRTFFWVLHGQLATVTF